MLLIISGSITDHWWATQWPSPWWGRPTSTPRTRWRTSPPTWVTTWTSRSTSAPAPWPPQAGLWGEEGNLISDIMYAFVMAPGWRTTQRTSWCFCLAGWHYIRYKCIVWNWNNVAKIIRKHGRFSTDTTWYESSLNFWTLLHFTRTFWEITARVFISSGISNLLHILTTNVQFYLNLMSFVSKCHGIIKDLNYLHS